MRTKLFAIIAGVALAASALAVTAGPVSAGGDGDEVMGQYITVKVTKEVIKGPDEATLFRISLTCTDEEEEHSATESYIVEWSDDELDPEDPFYLSVVEPWQGDVTCVLSEPVTGGAVTTTITCDEDEYGAECDGASLFIDEEALAEAYEVDDLFGAFTVVNDFTPAPVPPPPPAPPAPAPTPTVIIVQPTVTG